MSTTDLDPGQTAGNPACYRHPTRETYVRCTRCDRYACADCLRDAAVGHQCVECVREGNKTIRQARTVFGGRLSTNPVVTYALIAANGLVYVAELIWPEIVDYLDSLGVGLKEGGEFFVFDGRSYPGYELVGVAAGEWYRLITSAFLHLLPTEGLFGLAHIVFNMVWLWMLGRETEEKLGKVRFLALYLLSALGGSVLGYLVSPTQAALGASGAVFGLVAAYFIISRRLNHDPAGASRILIYSLIWLVVSAGFTSWEGHLGGLLVGGAVAVAFAHAPPNQRTAIHLGATAGMFVLLVALVLLKTVQITSGQPTI
jgi:membrane associated rhomboid family serine protease